MYFKGIKNRRPGLSELFENRLQSQNAIFLQLVMLAFQEVQLASLQQQIANMTKYHESELEKLSQGNVITLSFRILI